MLLKNETHMDKVLVTSKSTTNIRNLITKTDFQAICHTMKYNVLWITSKFGGYHQWQESKQRDIFQLNEQVGQ